MNEPTLQEIQRAANAGETLYTQRWWRSAVQVLLRDYCVLPDTPMPARTVRDALNLARKADPRPVVTKDNDPIKSVGRRKVSHEDDRPHASMQGTDLRINDRPASDFKKLDRT